VVFPDAALISEAAVVRSIAVQSVPAGLKVLHFPFEKAQPSILLSQSP